MKLQFLTHKNTYTCNCVKDAFAQFFTFRVTTSQVSQCLTQSGFIEDTSSWSAWPRDGCKECVLRFITGTFVQIFNVFFFAIITLDFQNQREQKNNGQEIFHDASLQVPGILNGTFWS